MKRIRFISALMLAFGSLMLAQPALASDWITTSGRVADGSVQFDWRGGSATQILQAPEGSTLTITVNNTIANCIGNCIPRPDTWSLTINGERWDGNSIDIMTIQTIVSGEVTIVATGKDEGFWGGWYGPIFSAPILTSPAPETGTWEGQTFSATAPTGEVFTSVTGWYGAPDDSTCGADVTQQLQAYLGSNTFTVESSNGVFGDPCGGVVKVLRVNLTSTVAPTEIEPEPTPTPTPTETPAASLDTPQNPAAPVESQPSQPVPEPTPSAAPSPTPQPTPSPVVTAPEPEPTLPVETPTPAPIVEQTPEPTLPTAPVVLPEPEVKATQGPLVEEKPLPELPIEPPIKTIEEHSITVIENLKEIAPSELTNAQVALLQESALAVFQTAEQGSPAYEQALEALYIVAQADDEKLPAELAAIPLLGNVAGAVLDTFNELGNIGADMSPHERAKAKKEVVASIAVGQAVMSTGGAVASAAYRRKV